MSSLSKKVNEQIANQLGYALTYLSMSFWADIEGYSGFATWCRSRGYEVRQSAQELGRFLSEFSGENVEVKLTNERKSYEFSSPKEAFQFLLDQELMALDTLEDMYADGDACLKITLTPLIAWEMQAVKDMRKYVAISEDYDDNSFFTV